MKRKVHTNATQRPEPTDVPCHHYATDVGRDYDYGEFLLRCMTERQAFIDQAAIALHARGVPLVSVFRKATELWDARTEWLKAQGSASPASGSGRHSPASGSGRHSQSNFSTPNDEHSGNRP